MYTINTIENDNYYVIYNNLSGEIVITISKRNSLEEVLRRLKLEREEVIIC